MNPSNPGITCGRFAPTPSGPLHFGSLVAALGSCLAARSLGGRWLVRMEDVDLPRVAPGADAMILRQLEALGFEWDGEVIYQSRRSARYREALDALSAQGRVFPCACTRAEMVDSALARDGSRIYPGTCRTGLPAGREARAWRFRVEDRELVWEDQVQGPQHENLAHDAGDFVLLRADGLFAYQLAVVVDDADQGVTDVVRGADLLDSTGRQLVLQEALGFARPRYAHLPVVTNAAGEKLSKQTLAPAVDPVEASDALWRALDFLGQCPPVELRGDAATALWSWAFAHWDMRKVPRVRQIAAGM